MRQYLAEFFGRKFTLTMREGSETIVSSCLLSRNVKPGELPYRVTFFTQHSHGPEPLSHLELEPQEADALAKGEILPGVLAHLESIFGFGKGAKVSLEFNHIASESSPDAIQAIAKMV